MNNEQLKAFIGVSNYTQVQADWGEDNPESVSFIKNKHLVETPIKNLELGLSDAINNFNNLLSEYDAHVDKTEGVHATINKKITSLESDVDSLESDTDTLKGYFTSNQGEDGKPSINRWNIPYYLNEAMVWGGDVNKLREVTISDALRSKNSIRIEDTTAILTSTNYTSFKNVYFTVAEDLKFYGEFLTKGDIIISTGTKWVTLIGTHPRTEITIINADANNVISFDFQRNKDELVHYIFDENNTTYVFDAECSIGENNKMTFYVLVTNNSTKDITFNLPYNQVLVIPQGKERYFEARVINDRYVFAIPSLSDTESKISTLENNVSKHSIDIAIAKGQRAIVGMTNDKVVYVVPISSYEVFRCFLPTNINIVLREAPKSGIIELYIDATSPSSYVLSFLDTTNSKKEIEVIHGQGTKETSNTQKITIHYNTEATLDVLIIKEIYTQ